MSQPRWWRLAAAAGATGLAMALLGGAPASADHSDVRYDIAQARAATAKYHDVQRALEDGYLADPECAESPAGTMGHHYVKPANFEGPLDVRKPQGLLYVPRADGGLRLVAVEYIAWDADNDTNTDEDRPYLFSRGFDGPMKGHADWMPVHYDLHAWIWAHNPNGTFAQWNPAVSC